MLQRLWMPVASRVLAWTLPLASGCATTGHHTIRFSFPPAKAENAHLEVALKVRHSVDATIEYTRDSDLATGPIPGASAVLYLYRYRSSRGKHAMETSAASRVWLVTNPEFCRKNVYPELHVTEYYAPSGELCACTVETVTKGGRPLAHISAVHCGYGR